MRSAIALIFLSLMRMKGSSSSTSIPLAVGDEVRAHVAAVELHALHHRRGGFRDLPSSTVMTPFARPTFSIASAMMVLPMVSSPLAEIVPTWAISFLSLVEATGSSATTVSTMIDAALGSIGLLAGGFQLQALLVDRAGQHRGGGGAVARGVGGLAGNLFTIWAPMFSNLFSRVDLLGDGDAVLGDRGRAERLLDDHVAALGPGAVAASESTRTPRRIASRAAW